MIVGIGVDSVEIERFAHWHTFSRLQLERVLSPAEIDYCLSIPLLSAQRFAVRFAAREALFKALSQAGYAIAFLKLCRAVLIAHRHTSAPFFVINREKLALPSLETLVSLTHTKNIATAFVIVQKNAQ